MSYYPDCSFSVDLDRITKRATKLKEFLLGKGKEREFVIFKNGTVIAVPSEKGHDPFEDAKIILSYSMSEHPDFMVIKEPYEDVQCNILLMAKGLVSTYMFSDEWDAVKKSLPPSKDMMCESEVLMGVDVNSDETQKGLYTRLRVFADAKDPQLHQVV